MALIVGENDFKKHISSKKWVNIYMMSGDEKYLIGFYRREFVKKLVGEAPPEFSYHEFHREVDLGSLTAAVGAVPFMTEYNCIVVTEMDFKNMRKDEYDDLVRILKSVPDTTVLIFEFTEAVPEKKDSGSDSKEESGAKKRDYFKLFENQIEKLGIVAKINTRTTDSLVHLVVKWAFDLNKTLPDRLADKIINYCGTDLTTLHCELEKICAYAGESDSITLDMIEAVVTKKLEARVYDLTDHVIAGNLTKAHQELQGLYAMREEPRDILRVLGYVYIDLYRARVTTESGLKMSDTAEFFKYGKRSWALSKANAKASDISTQSLRESLGEITELSEKFNCTSMNEAAAVENLVTKLSIIARKEAAYA